MIETDEAGSTPPKDGDIDTHDTIGERLLGLDGSDDAPDVSQARRRVQAALFGGPSSPPLDALERIGRFTLLERLGRGGMGVVYVALDPELNRKVAIKLLRPGHSEEASARARLLREAQAIARLSHPNVITVYESGTHGELVYIAMELVDGVDLRAASAKAETSREVLRLYCDAGRGLAAAHEAGLVHRDFKPENAMVGVDGRVRVLDFGLARSGSERPGNTIENSAATVEVSPVLLRPTDEPHPGTDADITKADTLHADAETAPRAVDARLGRTLTNTGTLMGTPAYMAPEQFLSGTASPRSDLFSFCVALYEALFGVRPFAGDTLPELVAQLTSGKIRPIPEDSKVPGRIRAVLLRGLKLDPDERYRSMKALLADLEDALSSRTRQRRRLTTGALAGFALFAGYLAAGSPEATDACASGVAAMAEEAWAPARQEALASAFAASGVPQAEAIWERIHARADVYAEAWIVGHRDACAAAEIANPQAQRLIELRSACLADARREFDATLGAMADADQTVIFNGIQALASLPSVERCSDSEALLAAVAPPTDPSLVGAVESARVRASEVRARRRLGLYPRALADIEALSKDTESLDFPPLGAEIGLLKGQLESNNARYEAAKKTLEEAFWRGIDAGHDDVATAAAIELAAVIGARQAALDTGLGWARQAEALLRRSDLSFARAIAIERVKARMLRVSGDSNQARVVLDAALAKLLAADPDDDLGIAGLLRDLGGVALDQGKADEALDFLGRGIERSRAALGPEHPSIGLALHLVGTAKYTVSRYDEALETFQEALLILKAAYGENHPEVADTLNNMGATYDELRRLDEALAAYERALKIRSATLGEEHPDVAATLDNLAFTLVKLDRMDEAEAAMARAHRTLLAAHGDKHPAVGHNYLQQASFARNREDFSTSLDLARKAMAIYLEVNGEDHPDVAFALVEIANSELDRGSPAAAIEPARRALEIREIPGRSPLYAAEARLRLGQALWLSKDPKRGEALALIRDARAVYHSAKAPAEELSAIDEWLKVEGIELDDAAP